MESAWIQAGELKNMGQSWDGVVGRAVVVGRDTTINVLMYTKKYYLFMPSHLPLSPFPPRATETRLLYHSFARRQLLETTATMATAAPSSGSVPNRGPSLMALMWVCTVVSSITIVLRFVFRARKAIIGWDDLFMLVALVRPPFIPPSLSPAVDFR